MKFPLALTGICIALSNAAFSSAVLAEDTDFYAPTWSFEGAGEVVGIQSEQADREGVETSAIALGLYAHYNHNSWITSLRGSFISYSDNSEFSQLVEVEDFWDDDEIESRSSDANAFTLGVATGKMWRFGEELRTAALLQLGYDHLFASERTISGCSNCYSEDIDIDGGAFVQGSLKHNAGAVSIGLSLTQYFGDGLNTRVGISIGSRF